MSEIFITPLNTIYTYGNTFINIAEHENFYNNMKNEFESKNLSNDFKCFLTTEKSLKIVSHVEKEFLQEILKLGFKIIFIAIDSAQLQIINAEVEVLGLNKYVSGVSLLTELPENIIFMSEDLNFHKYLKTNSLFFLSINIFKKNNAGIELLNKNNIDLFKTSKPNFMLESPRQCINILKYIIENKDKQKPIKALFNDFLGKCLRILYFFDLENFRKREVVVTTNEVLYIPLITKHYGDLTIYGEFDLFLQRAPYFYLDNKARAFEIQAEVDKLKITSLHNFSVVDNTFYRFNVFNYLSAFISQVESALYEKYNIRLRMPKSVVMDITEHDTKDDITAKITGLAKEISYPFIIKPDPCSEHSLFLIISEEGIKKFLSDEKLYKYNRYLLQEFIPHGGIMFKNYYLNEKSITTTRPSLPNLEGKNLEVKQFEDKFMKFHNESIYAKADKSFFESIEINDKIVNDINYEAIEYISKLFYEINGISLFGLDYLFDNKTNTYYMLEINYFPSYREFTDFQNEFNKHVLNYYNKFKNN
jgi:hypothetical protein